MRKVSFRVYLISSILCLLVFQFSFVSFATTNSSVPKEVTGAVQEIKDNVRQVDRGELSKSSSEITKSLGDVGKKIIDTLVKPIAKVVIQISISLFKLIIGFLEYLKNLV
ncbi:MAG: hypothetical protein HZA35_02715 [Parcubacteria group bacterium]|nr:hypothetical protein [Parcubacteria group bacterium]